MNEPNWDEACACQHARGQHKDLGHGRCGACTCGRFKHAIGGMDGDLVAELAHEARQHEQRNRGRVD